MGLLVSLDATLQPVEVGTVPDVGLVDLYEEMVVFQCTEPVDPPDLYLLAEFAIVRHSLIIFELVI